LKNDEYTIVPIYVEDELSPKARDVILDVVKEKFPDREIRFANFDKMLDRKVLVLGRVHQVGAIPPDTEIVYTYSVPQIMTKPNAATVLSAAIRRFFTEPDPIPFDGPIGGVDPTIHLTYFDFDKPTAIDIETSGHLGKVHTPEEVELLSVAFYQEGRPPVVLVGGSSGKFTTGQLVELTEYLPKFNKAIYHNGKFDIRVLNRILCVKLTNWFDTMLAHHVLNQAAGDHKLKHLAQLYLAAPEWEQDIKKYTKGGGYYENIPKDLLIQYNGYDVYWTWKLWELFAPQIDADEEAQKAFLLEMSAAEFLLDVEVRGIPFDVKYAERFRRELEAKQLTHLTKMRHILGDGKFNPNSPKQIKEAYEKWAIVLATTNEEMLNEILELYGSHLNIREFTENLLSYRKATKMLSTYVKGWGNAEREGRVHPTFLVHGTSTGRLSSTGPNAQNFPRDKSVRRLVAVNERNQYVIQ